MDSTNFKIDGEDDKEVNFYTTRHKGKLITVLPYNNIFSTEFKGVDKGTPKKSKKEKCKKSDDEKRIRREYNTLESEVSKLDKQIFDLKNDAFSVKNNKNEAYLELVSFIESTVSSTLSGSKGLSENPFVNLYKIQYTKSKNSLEYNWSILENLVTENNDLSLKNDMDSKYDEFSKGLKWIECRISDVKDFSCKAEFDNKYKEIESLIYDLFEKYEIQFTKFIIDFELGCNIVNNVEDLIKDSHDKNKSDSIYNRKSKDIDTYFELYKVRLNNYDINFYNIKEYIIQLELEKKEKEILRDEKMIERRRFEESRSNSKSVDNNIHDNEMLENEGKEKYKKEHEILEKLMKSFQKKWSTGGTIKENKKYDELSSESDCRHKYEIWFQGNYKDQLQVYLEEKFVDSKIVYKDS